MYNSRVAHKMLFTYVKIGFIKIILQHDPNLLPRNCTHFLKTKLEKSAICKILALCKGTTLESGNFVNLRASTLEGNVE